MSMLLRLTVLFLLLVPVAAATGQGGKARPLSPPPVKLSAEAVETKLRARTDVVADRVPLQEVLQKLSKQHGVPIGLDKPGLEKARVASDVRISVTLKNFTLDAALRRILTERGLGTHVENGSIMVTDATIARNKRIGGERGPENGRFVMIGNAAAPAADALMQQYLPQFQRILRVEMRLVESICKPTPQQLQQITQEGEQHVRDVARNYSLGVRNAQRNLTSASASSDLDPRSRIQEKLAGLVKTHLTAQQSADYSNELEKRAQYTRRAVVRNVVARIDRALFLSAEQREKLSESLTANWADAQSYPLEAFLLSDELIPLVPDALVLPLLNETQQRAWVRLPKSRQTVFDFGWVFGVVDVE